MTDSQTPQSLDAGTEYVVLKATGEGADQQWPTYEYALVARNITARDSATAIRLYASKAGDLADGLYVAIPLRSWKPVTVQVKIEKSLVLEEAKS